MHEIQRFLSEYSEIMTFFILQQTKTRNNKNRVTGVKNLYYSCVTIQLLPFTGKQAQPAERSEGSRITPDKILRCAQD